MEVVLAQPRGFCAGVVRAIEIVQQALKRYGNPVYVLHEIVHNRYVVDGLRKRGARFVDDLERVPRGAVIIFSAHGVGQEVVRRAKERRLRIIDATCPLVTKVHLQARRYGGEGREILIIGHAGHPEVEGTLGQVEGPAQVLLDLDEVEALRVRDPDKVAYVTQTTLSVDETREVVEALKRRFPNIQGPDVKDICYATQARQDAVRRLAREVDVLLVVGARNSSNSNRLREMGEQQGLPAYLAEDAGDLHPGWFTGRSMVGVTAGASTPEVLVQGVVGALRQLRYRRVREMPGKPEVASFRLPKSLFQPDTTP